MQPPTYIPDHSIPTNDPVGISQETESQNQQTQSTQTASQPINNTVLDGHLWGFLQPCSASLTRIDFWRLSPTYSVGRNEGNDVVLPGFKISNKHCRITWDSKDDRSSAVTVYDTSSNGTWINGKKIGKGCTQLLREGNEIAFGTPHPQPQNGGIEDYRFVYRHTAAGFPDTGLYAHYDISTELGKGSFATVMKAVSRATGQWYAVKMIHKERIARTVENANQNNASRSAQLSREINILEKLKHPNICQLKEVFYQDGDINLVLELVEGGDLLDYILGRGGLTEKDTRHITYQICDALSYIHGLGVAHRDLKPENVLLTTDDPPIVKVADFGLAKVVDSLTMLRTMCGTPSYLAPEVVLQTNREGYQHVVDSWSVGVIVFSMLTNTSPFIEDETQRDLRTRIAERTVDWNTLIHAQVSGDCQSFIRRLLESRPTVRMTLSAALQHPWLRAYIPVYPNLHHRSTRSPTRDSMTNDSIFSEFVEHDESFVGPDPFEDAGVSQGLEHLRIAHSVLSAEDSAVAIVSSIPGAFPNGHNTFGIRREGSRTAPLQRRSNVLSQAAEGEERTVVPEPSWEMIQSIKARGGGGGGGGSGQSDETSTIGGNEHGEVRAGNKRVHSELTPLPEGYDSDGQPGVNPSWEANGSATRKRGRGSDEEQAGTGPKGKGRGKGKGKGKGKGAMKVDDGGPSAPVAVVATTRPRRSSRQTPHKAARRA